MVHIGAVTVEAFGSWPIPVDNLILFNKVVDAPGTCVVGGDVWFGAQPMRIPSIPILDNHPRCVARGPVHAVA